MIAFTRRAALTVACLFTALLFAPQYQAHAMQIQRVVSPGGIEAWLVEDHRVPLMAMQFGWEGGAAQDAAGKEGTAYFVSGMLDEGAGDLVSVAFQERLEELAVRLRFDSGLDSFTGKFETLTENRAAGAELLRLALTAPRFDEDAIARVRSQIVAALKFDMQDPEALASKAWYGQAFAGHVYGRPTKGTMDSLSAITADDLRGFARRTLARDTLKVAVVGDITPAELGALLDTVFGGLPATAQLAAVPRVEPAGGGKTVVVELDVPQSVVTFGREGFLRKDPDFVPAFVLNYIVGGGGFASRLMEEVREKRGLAYSVYSYVNAYKQTGLFMGGVATENRSVAQSISVIKDVLRDLATNGVSEEDLANAKAYLTGSYPLRFDTSSKIASQLLGIQMEGLGIDYVDQRNAQIEAVTIADLKRVAERLLQADDLFVTVVGRPEGLDGATVVPGPRG